MNQKTKLGESTRLPLEKVAQKTTAVVDITSFIELKEKYQLLPTTITVKEELVVCSDFLIDISAETKLLEKIRLESTEELRSMTDQINKAFAPYTSEMKEMRQVLTDRILEYNREQERIARQAQERLEAERQAEQIKLNREREEKQKTAVFPDEVPEVKTVPIPQFVPMVGTVKTETGSVGTKSVVSYSKIQTAIDSGIREIQGVKIYQVWMFEVIEADKVPKEYRQDVLTSRRK